MLDAKLETLRGIIRAYGSCLVAYSGGVDSVFLARVTREVLKDRSLAVIADSPSLPRRELAEALDVAAQFDIPVRVIETREFSNPDYLTNAPNRCFFCKHELFDVLDPLARAEGFAVIVYGENASDASDFRPGAQAAARFGVKAPLKDAGLSKTEIRALSAGMGLPTADKPQMACLSSRVPHGEPVTPEKIRMIEAAEYVLRDLGFYDVRVRHHEIGVPPATPELQPALLRMPASAPGGGNRRSLARIEVGPREIPRLLEGANYQRVDEALRKIGYAHVTVDLQGYRSAGATPGSVKGSDFNASGANTMQDG